MAKFTEFHCQLARAQPLYLLGSPQNSLYFLRLQDTSQISVGHLGHWEVVILLPAGLLAPSAVQRIQFTESWKNQYGLCNLDTLELTSEFLLVLSFILTKLI